MDVRNPIIFQGWIIQSRVRCSVQGSIVQSRGGAASLGVECLVLEYPSYQGLISWSKGGLVSPEVAQSVHGLVTQSKRGSTRSGGGVLNPGMVQSVQR